MQVGLPICIMVLLAEMHNLKSDKGMRKRKGCEGLEFLIWFASPTWSCAESLACLGYFIAFFAASPCQVDQCC
jgi:hypothetical protein